MEKSREKSTKPNRKRTRKGNSRERDKALMQSMMENTTWVKGIFDKIIEKYDREFESDEEGAELIEMNRVKIPKHSKTTVKQGDSEVDNLGNESADDDFYYSYNKVGVQEKDPTLDSQKGITNLKKT